MFDQKGAAKVSDFGLAKNIRPHGNDVTHDQTATGQIVGTPAYMAPEQSIGVPSKLSDVYSIGAILYTLLTGRPPFQAPSLAEILRQLQETEPVEPRRLNSLIPRDLETIAMKCLNKSPEARYASAEAVAVELTRFMEGEPILARPTSRMEYLWRWSKRQPVVAGLTAAAFLSLVTGVAVSLWFYTIAKDKERLATENFEYATSTVKKYLSDVAASPELKEKGLETLRQSLLSTAKDFYLQLDKRSANRQQIRETLADSHFNLAVISKELGELEEAGGQYDRMIAKYQELQKSSPKNLQYSRAIAKGYQERAEVFIKRNQFDEGIRDLEQAVVSFHDIWISSQNWMDQVHHASALAALGTQLATLDRAADEEAAFEELEKLCEVLQKDIPEISLPADAVRLVSAYDQLALNVQRKGRFDVAEKWFLANAGLCARLLELDPKNQETMLGLARTNKNLSLIYAKMQRFEEGKTRFEQADKIYERLTKEHPLVIEYLDGRANSWINFGGLQNMRGERESAEIAFQKGLLLQSEVVSRQPEVIEHRVGLGVLCSNFGVTLQQRGNWLESERVLKSGIESFESVVALRDNVPSDYFFLAMTNNNLGTLYRDMRRFDEAMSTYEKSSSMAKKLIEKSTDAVDYQVLAAKTNANLAGMARKLGEIATAATAANESMRVVENLLKRNATSVEYRNLQANTISILAEIELDQHRLDESIRRCLQAQEIFTQLISTAPNPNRFQLSFGAVLYDLGQLAIRQNHPLEALDLNSQAIQAFMLELKQREPDGANASRRAREFLANAHREEARALFLLDRVEEAIDSCKTGLEFENSSQSDSLRALYARVLAATGKRESAQQMLDSMDRSAELNFSGNVDLAASLATLASNGPANEDRDPRIIEALTRAANLDPVLIQLVRDDAEFTRMQEWSELRSLWP